MADEMTVRVEWPRDRIALVVLDRPSSLNSMSRQLVAELGTTLAELEREGRADAAILTGEGRGFCSGHDLDELIAEADDADRITMMQNQRAYSELIVALNEVSLPVVAAVNGPATGGGFALALASDVRLCSTTARFGTAFIKLGISGCDVGVSYLLPRIVGPTAAFEMMMSARLIDADEASRIGLVNEVVPDGELIDAALAVAERIVAHDRFTVSLTKQLMWANLDAPSLRHAVLIEDRTQVFCILSGDADRSIAAVRESIR